MFPVIGITTNFAQNQEDYLLHQAHVKAIEQAGGIPLILPYLNDEAKIAKIIAHIDGLYLSGGADIDPIYYGEEPHGKLGRVVAERDQFELILTQKALEKNMPIFGVCRGAQVLNVACGGTMYQDIYACYKTDMQHVQTASMETPYHSIELVKDSKLFHIIGVKSIRVNSNHHQANRDLGKHIMISATAPDGVIEAIESTKHSFVLGVQWHPERLFIRGDEAAKKLFTAFITACKMCRKV